MMPPRLVDTNIFLRYLTRDIPARATRALALLARVEVGQEEVVTTSVVVSEVVFTLQGQHYKRSREDIRQLLLPLLQLRGLQLRDLPLANGAYDQHAMDLYVQHRISWADACNAAFMLREGIAEIYSWDTDFDKLPGLTRLEP